MYFNSNNNNNNNASLSRAASSLAMQYAGAPQAQNWHHQLGLSELESVTWRVNSEVSSNNVTCNNSSCCSSGCTSYMGSPSSMASYESTRRRACLMQRSVSSHSLQHNNGGAVAGAHHYPYSHPLFTQTHFIHSPVRRAASTGDLQRFRGIQHYHHSDSPLLSESSLIIEEMSRTSPYSPEEKKVRIERYRNKRNQRNFGKKIKYACRKTLADSRPRIRGRFARNDEIAVNHPPVQWSHMVTGEEEDEDEENWANFFDSLVPANLAREPQGNSSFGVFY